MSGTFEFAMAKATPDVAATFLWLISRDAEITRERGGPNEASGDVLIEFTLEDVVLLVTRDRTQWMLDVQCGQLESFDFDVIHSALTGDDTSSLALSESRPAQLPDGVSWVAQLPRALVWLRTTPDARSQLLRLQHDRADRLFG